MKERFLMRISLVGGFIGIVAIYIIVSHADFAGVKIGSITGDMIGIPVNITGTVNDIYRHKDGHIFFTLSDGRDEIRIVIWKDTTKRMNFTLKENMDVNVIGNVEVYKGEPEIITKSVKPS